MTRTLDAYRNNTHCYHVNLFCGYILRNVESSTVRLNKIRYYIALYLGLAHAHILNSISLYQLSLFYSRNLYLQCVSHDSSCFVDIIIATNLVFILR
jgi:hypothetical protein